MAQRLDFSEWRVQVNRELYKICTLTAEDLPDCDYWRWWDRGTTPAAAAKRAMKAAW